MYQPMVPKVRLTNYLTIPRPVLELPLNATELLVYGLLLERAKLSAQNPEWTDEEGRVFLFFPVEALAQALGKNPSTVKRAMNRLEAQGLLLRQRQGSCRANKLYVQVPKSCVITDPPPSFPGMRQRSGCGNAVDNDDIRRVLARKRQELGVQV